MTFHELYSNYYSRSFRFVKSYVRDDGVAEDIVSDAMITLWQKAKSGELKEATLLPYAFKVLRNRSLDYLKSKRAKCEIAGLQDDWQTGEIDLMIQSLADTSEEKIFSDEISSIVASTLAKMPQRSREIFRLSRIDGKTYLEIAKMFDMTDKGVEYHMNVALKLLRAALKDYFPGTAIFF